MKLFILSTLYVFPQKAVHKVPLRWSEWGTVRAMFELAPRFRLAGRKNYPTSVTQQRSLTRVPTYLHMTTSVHTYSAETDAIYFESM